MQFPGNTAQHIYQHLLGDHQLLPNVVCLQLMDYRLAIRSNSMAFLQRMQDYFSHVLIPDCESAGAEVHAIERDVIDPVFEFVDWKREQGKTGRKDAIHDFEDGRLVRKVRTGMVFLQSSPALVAVGPCLENDNQVINFINSQFLNWFQNNDFILCHAAALSVNGNGLAIAGLSGGGKSTLMLNLLEDTSTAFVTNDRLLVKKRYNDTLAVGIPKLPRINPGTIVNNPRLKSLIDEDSRERLLQLDKQELWALEHKYDVDIKQLYGDQRIQHDAALRYFLVLNWHHDAEYPVQLQKVDLSERKDVLGAIMKPSGPFYVDTQGNFNSDDAMPDAAAYLAALQQVEIYEAVGRVDFARLGKLCHDELIG
jgi:HprK-related kinase B